MDKNVQKKLFLEWRLLHKTHFDRLEVLREHLQEAMMAYLDELAVGAKRLRSEEEEEANTRPLKVADRTEENTVTAQEWSVPSEHTSNPQVQSPQLNVSHLSLDEDAPQTNLTIKEESQIAAELTIEEEVQIAAEHEEEEEEEQEPFVMCEQPDEQALPPVYCEMTDEEALPPLITAPEPTPDDSYLFLPYSSNKAGGYRTCLEAPDTVETFSFKRLYSAPCLLGLSTEQKKIAHLLAEGVHQGVQGIFDEGSPLSLLNNLDLLPKLLCYCATNAYEELPGNPSFSDINFSLISCGN